MTKTLGASRSIAKDPRGIRKWLADRVGGRRNRPGHCADEIEYPPDGEDDLYLLARHPTSLTLRHLDCGSCNGCEQQLLALTNPCYDIEAYGITFEASPRHAVYLAMTGVFTRGLAEVAGRTLEAMPEPGVIAIGDCAVNGGPFGRADGGTSDSDGTSYALAKRPAAFGPMGGPGSQIELEIPGCPPTPAEIMVALAKLVHLRRN